MSGFSLVSDDHFDLVFFFSVNKVQWWLGIIRAVFHSFPISQEKRGMEDRMNFPLRRDP